MDSSSNPCVAESINDLQSALNNNYLVAEKLMFLRHPSKGKQSRILSVIDIEHQNLIKTLSKTKNEEEIVAAALKNKTEFDAQVEEWYKPCAYPESELVDLLYREVTGTSLSVLCKSPSIRSSHSYKTGSSRSAISIKRLKAHVELETAKLEAKHLSEQIANQNVLEICKWK